MNTLDTDRAVAELAALPQMPPWWPVLMFWAETGKQVLDGDDG